MSRSILTRIIALVVITGLGLYYILFDAVQITPFSPPFTVHADLVAAGGIYPDASVTYRGIEVGKVSGVQLKSDMVVANLSIKHGQKIPADVTASVRELTAAGEQYIDLVPPAGRANLTAAGSAPYLTNNYTIPLSRTSIPVSVGQLLTTLNSLVNSLHASDLNSISKTFATGLQNAGSDLRSIIVDSKTLLTALQSAVPGTLQLIDAGNTVLNTFNLTSDSFSSFASSLNQLSQTVATSNSDFVHLLQNGSTASSTLNSNLQAYGPSTVNLINDLGTLSNLSAVRLPAAQALFQVLPVVSSDLAATTQGGQLHFELLFNDRNTICPYTSNMVEPTVLVAAASLYNNCANSAPDMLQRGAGTAPTPAVPTATP